jgi:hypothetical protein
MEDTQHLARRLLLIIALIAVVILIALIAMKLLANKNSAKLHIQVTPSVATVTINGQKRKAGVIAVSPGTYKVTASMKGFASQTQTYKVDKGGEQYYGFALISNDPSTADWYSNHPADQTALAAITGQRYQQQGSQSIQQVPLIKNLPYIGVGFEFRVDYGEPLPGTNVPGIYITAKNDQGYQDALTWIRDQGYDPNTLHIKYTQGDPENSNNT